jgi:hypothetical protein
MLRGIHIKMSTSMKLEKGVLEITVVFCKVYLILLTSAYRDLGSEYRAETIVGSLNAPMQTKLGKVTSCDSSLLGHSEVYGLSSTL